MWLWLLLMLYLSWYLPAVAEEFSGGWLDFSLGLRVFCTTKECFLSCCVRFSWWCSIWTLLLSRECLLREFHLTRSSSWSLQSFKRKMRHCNFLNLCICLRLCLLIYIFVLWEMVLRLLQVPKADWHLHQNYYFLERLIVWVGWKEKVDAQVYRYSSKLQILFHFSLWHSYFLYKN